VEIVVQLDDHEISFTVRDRGPGIAPEDLPRLFRPFSRVPDPGGTGHPGAGLGLYISRQIVEAHGGSITVESEVGRGSSFRFALLPAHRQRDAMDG
jgi:signal transduction histidine kinase